MERRYLAIFFYTMFLIGTDTFIISPLLPTLRELYHTDPTQTGWLVGSYALGYALFALFVGPLSDGWNRKRVMSLGMLGFALSTMACGFAEHYATMLVFRFLAGICSAFIGPQIWAAIPALFPPVRIGKAMGIVMTGLTVSQFVGVPLGSFLAAVDISFPFLAVGAASLLAWGLILCCMPDLKPAAPPSDTGTKNRLGSIWPRYRDLLTLPGAARYFLAYFCFMTGFYAFFSFFGMWLADQYAQSVSQIGITTVYAGLGNTVGSLISGWLLEKWGRRNVLTVGFMANALLFSALPHVPSLGFVQVVISFTFFFGGMLVPIVMGLLQTLSTSSRGTISSLANACMYAGTLTGSALSGMLYHSFGFIAITLITSAGMLAAYFMYVPRLEKKRIGASV
ncbi:MFS transporter [Brevibacillus choshinensis]|uniref:MFS transporter n=1 Tax=Brevibacillus choshinensis TaxID=54911 RepID=A0ABX7FQA2_BRECH|nr:MFS transporter [Brevibacillus choshinensis]QRG68416.1 MFS transporter [Brevibacillus choshinensis]